MITLKDIVFSLCGYEGEIPNISITAATIDSRIVIPGSMFIAIPGERVDGHSFVSEAFEQGALIALVGRDLYNQFPIINLSSHIKTDKITLPPTPFCLQVENTLTALQQIAHHWRRQLPVRVIAITGSVGKSTTKELVAEVLNQKYTTFKNPGNYNNEIGLPLTILNIGRGYQRVVLEMGFYQPGEIAFLCDIALPSTGIITNVGTVHAERAGSQSEIAKGKAELIEALPVTPEGIAILNYDDPLVHAMAEKTRARIISYGLDPQADLWADQIQSHGLEGISFHLHHEGKVVKMHVPLMGRHSVMTALRAIAAGWGEGLSMDEITKGLLQGHSQLRMRVVRPKSGVLILDDTYNATPESTMAALDILADMSGKKIAVLGDMLELGAYEVEGHQQVGQHAAQIVEMLIAVGPRGKIIADAARAEGLPANRILYKENAQQATADLLPFLHEGVTMLIKGSHGMRMDKISAVLEETT